MTTTSLVLRRTQSLLLRRSSSSSVARALFSSNASPIPVVPDTAMAGEDKTLNRLERTESKYALGKHRSNALELVNRVPPIEVTGDMAICDGGGGALGHPIEYIKVGYNGGKPVSCIYCGLKFVQKGGGDHH